MDIQLEFKDEFIRRYDKLTDIKKFKEYCSKFLRKSIRVNTIKISVDNLKKRLSNWNLEQIKWCKQGFFISGTRRDVGNLIEHSLGYFYVQEAVSMIPALVLDPKESDIILDMAAAPGSKTIQIAALMKNKGLIIANDYKIDRLKALSINLQRCGVSNVIMTKMEGRFFKNFKFDKILLDAPCSGTGTIRKSPKTLKIWNPHMIKRIVGIQKQLIRSAYENLKDNGILVYSTCSLEPEENEGVIDFLLSKYDAKLETININIKRSNPILNYDGISYNKEIKKCLRIWPQDNDTGGFFVAKIRKE